MIPSWKSLIFVTILGVVGCADDIPPTVSQSPAEGTEVVPPGLASLSPEDRQLVSKQKTCPVTNEELGSKEEPIKMTVGNTTLFVCCPGCYSQVLKDPEKYLAVVNLPSTAETPSKP